MPRKKNRKKRKNSKAQKNAEKFDQIAEEQKIESKEAHKPSELAQTLTQKQTAKINKDELKLVETQDSILGNLENIAPVKKAKEKLLPDGGGAEDNVAVPRKSEIEELEDLGKVKQFFERRSSQSKVVGRVSQNPIPAPIQEDKEIIVAKMKLDRQRTLNRVELEKTPTYVEPKQVPDSPEVHAVMTKETSLDDLGIAAATPVTKNDFESLDDILQSSETPQPAVGVLSQTKTDPVPNPPIDEPPAIVDEDSDVMEFDEPDEQSPLTPLEAYEIIEPETPAEIVEEEVFEEFGEDFEAPDDTPVPVVVKEEAEKQEPIEVIEEEEEDFMEFGEDFEVPDDPVIVEKEAEKEEAKEEVPQEKEEPPVEPEEAPTQEIEQEASEPISKEIEDTQPVRKISATSLPAVIPEVSQPEEVEMEKTTSISPVLSSETNLDDLEDEERPVMEEINLSQDEPAPKTKELERRVSFKEDQDGEVVKDLLESTKVDAKITTPPQESKKEEDPLDAHGAASKLLRTMFASGEYCV